VSGTRHENFGTTLSKCDRWIKDVAGTNANLSPGEPFWRSFLLPVDLPDYRFKLVRGLCSTAKVELSL